MCLAWNSSLHRTLKVLWRLTQVFAFAQASLGHSSTSISQFLLRNKGRIHLITNVLLMQPTTNSKNMFRMYEIFNLSEKKKSTHCLCYQLDIYSFCFSFYVTVTVALFLVKLEFKISIISLKLNIHDCN